MITREADYAIRVVLCLAQQPDHQPLSTTTVAEQMLVPYRFLRKIVRKLTQSGIVASVRGKEGGIFLNQAPRDISLHAVISLFDPNALVVNSCYLPGSTCAREATCQVHRALATVQEQIDGQLRKINFATLLKI